MTGATVEKTGGSRCLVSGSLNFRTVMTLLAESVPVFEGLRRIDIDLAGVVRSDSAGLALLIEWMKRAELRKAHIEFHNMPEQMMTIARVTGMTGVLKVS